MENLKQRVLRLWRNGEEQEYEHLAASESEVDRPPTTNSKAHRGGFSWVEYAIFLLLGVSMLWAWNMFLAAGPYFQRRFQGNKAIFDNFQAAEISVSTVTNLGSMLILTRMQANASYPKRIIASLLINMVTFSLLAISTAVAASAEVYFGFLMVTIFGTSLAAGLCQNGLFAYVSGFGEAKYTQGIMTGQAVAGVLPCIAQIVSVLSVQGKHQDQHPLSDGPPQGPSPVPWTAALAYFLTATAISVITLLAFSILSARNRTTQKPLSHEDLPEDIPSSGDRKAIPLLYLFRKLFWLAGGVFVTFAVTMVFPVFTQRIISVRPPSDQPAILQPPSFIPLALLFWNVGDLVGRLMTAVESLSLVRRPRIVFGLAVSRIVFVGLYHLCNIRGRGAVVNSDFFYLVVVQLFFGISNGFLGSTCMMGAGEWVEPDEQEAAGGFMGLCLVGGLTAGSLLSFFIG